MFVLLMLAPYGWAQEQSEHERILRDAGRIIAYEYAEKDTRVYLCPQHGGLQLWDVGKEELIKDLKPDSPAPMRSPQLTKDGRRLFALSGIMLTCLDLKKNEWSKQGAVSGIPKKRLPSGSPQSALVLEPRGRWMFLGGIGGRVVQIDPKDTSLRPKVTARLQSDLILTMAADPSMKKIAVGADNQRIRIMLTSSMKWKAEMEGHEGAVNSLAFDSKGKLLASGSSDRTVRLWSPNSGKMKAKLEGHEDAVTAVIFQPKGNLLISGDASGKVKVWNWKEEALVMDLDLSIGKRVEEFSFSKDGKRLTAAGIGDGLVVWDMDVLLD
jgi:WD40 repeat protein